MRAGRPDLLPVDHIVVAIELGPSLQRGQVAPRARFQITLAPGDGSARDARKMFALLLLRAMNDQRRPDHAYAEDALAVRRAVIAKLLGEDCLLDVRRS